MPRRSPADLIRDKDSVEALRRTFAYQEAMTSTVEGRRSDALRRRAQQLAEMGRRAAAFPLFQEALAIHEAGDRGPAVASALYDLAEAWKRRESGSREENLRTAVRLYERSLECPERRDDWLRHALTLDGLAQAYRLLAEAAVAPDEAARALDLAEVQAREAMRIARQCGFVGEVALAGYTLTFANIQFQRGRDASGLEALKTAESTVRDAVRPDPFSNAESVLGTIRLNLAERYAARKDGPGRKRALRYVQKILRDTPPDRHDEALVLLAQLHLDGGQKDSALATLRNVRPERLPPERLARFADLLVQTGDDAAALDVLGGRVRDLVASRTETMADVASDVVSASAQALARAIARIHHRRGDPLLGFLALDEVVGLRFEDAAVSHLWTPPTPVIREVARRYGELSGAAALLDDLASLLRRIPGDADPRSVLASQLEVLSSASASIGKRGPDVAAVEAALKEACTATDPAAALVATADSLRGTIMALESRLDELDPSRERGHRGPGFALTEETLPVLFADDPALVVVHIDVFERRLLAFAVRMEGGALLPTSLELPLDPEGLPAALQLGSARVGDPTETADRFFAICDLSPLFPPDSDRRDLVLVPSGFARFLPLGALGPSGCTPIERFASVSWLPNVAPLRARQGASPPRRGVATFVPPGTRFGEAAFRDLLTDERLFRGVDATTAALAAARADADVVVLYSHGRHAGALGSEVDLADGVLASEMLTSQWCGLERLELWACQTGVDWPNDPRTPFVDESFGLDGALVSLGVRSAIGTLWSVPDIVTAALVQRYRVELRRGIRADRALAAAQRWWKSEGIGSLIGRLERLPVEEAVRAFARDLGAAGDPGSFPDHVGCALGPAFASDLPMQPADVTSFEATLRSPVSWAGYRFLGVCEHRPRVEWTADHAREPTAEELEEVERLVNVFPRQASYDEAIEDVLERETGRTLREEDFTADRALAVARLYRDRIVASHAHNLVRGLGWLHEALVRGVGTPEERDEIKAEAAHLWLQFAIAFVGLPRLKDLTPAPRRAIERATELLGGLPRDRESGARALAEVLCAANRNATVAVVRQAARSVPVGAGFEGALGSNDHLLVRARDLTHWALVLSFGADEAPEVARGVIGEATLLARVLPGNLEYVGAGHRMLAAAAVLESLVTPEVGLAFEETDLLTAPEQAALDFAALRDLGRDGARAAESGTRRISEALGIREVATYGHPKDDRTPFWRATGRTCAAYRLLAGSFLASAANAPIPDERGAHLIASMQYLADLRVPVLKRWRCLFGADTEQLPVLPALWLLMRDREAALDLLVDLAVLPKSIPIGTRGRDAVEAHPGRLDPFSLPPERLKPDYRGPADLPAWFLGEATEWLRPSETCATAAFRVARNAELATASLVTSWTGFLEAHTKAREQGVVPDGGLDPWSLADPGHSLEANQRLVESLPAGYALVAVGLAADLRLVVASAWGTAGGLKQRVGFGDEKTALAVRLALTEALAPEFDALTPRARQREAWSSIAAGLDGVLSHMLGPVAAEGGYNLAVLAPGPLRALPWLGLTVGGTPLYRRFGSVVLLPSLAWLALEGAGQELDPLGCLLVEDEEEVGACGQAAIRTLRRWFPPAVTFAAPTAPGTDIPEAGAMEEAAPGLARLRLYGGDRGWKPVDAASGLGLSSGRTFADHNTRGIALRRCREVQLWTATGSLAEVGRILANRDDRIPGLARSLLMCGADGVLDLAWPVPDPLRALACERFNLLRAQGAWGAFALTETLRQLRAEIEFLRAHIDPTSGPEYAMLGFDTLRRRGAELGGVAVDQIEMFAEQDQRVPRSWKSAGALLDDLLDPVHWAAFRWWGT